MGSTYRFISAPGGTPEVLSWFRELKVPPREVITDRSTVLLFEDLGPLRYAGDGTVDGKSSPVATLFLPTVKRGVLWTVGELHFLATPLRKLYPSLHRIASDFSAWLEDHQCVFSNKRSENPYNYYLEGSVRNRDAPIFAFDSGLSALSSGRYFVGEADNEAVLDKLCKQLHLRGIDCG
jgi:hypothetical protein